MRDEKKCKECKSSNLKPAHILHYIDGMYCVEYECNECGYHNLTRESEEKFKKDSGFVKCIKCGSHNTDRYILHKGDERSFLYKCWDCDNEWMEAYK